MRGYFEHCHPATELLETLLANSINSVGWLERSQLTYNIGDVHCFRVYTSISLVRQNRWNERARCVCVAVKQNWQVVDISTCNCYTLEPFEIAVRYTINIWTIKKSGGFFFAVASMRWCVGFHIEKIKQKLSTKKESFPLQFVRMLLEFIDSVTLTARLLRFIFPGVRVASYRVFFSFYIRTTSRKIDSLFKQSTNRNMMQWLFIIGFVCTKWVIFRRLKLSKPNQMSCNRKIEPLSKKFDDFNNRSNNIVVLLLDCNCWQSNR